MTTSTITRERLEEIRDCCWMDDLGLSMYELSELARIALAAIDSEPVGEFYEDGPLNWYQISDGDRVPAHRRIPLYRHAQPAPVVPDIDELRLAFEAAERESDDGFNLHKYGIGYADDETQGRWDTWLACRAAMLNGGNDE
ncbi:hypothetical protein AE04_00293 [Klebsiella aerogenes MGH 78]|uniref:hypothetical protein n=1 Tax=Klebsiella aerogenes TaxID=548 RepID=UPI00049FD826|nr:hypothetical protein [Klebsiella aerogenes]KDF37791.1 hypothetical protein AE04_00293 [Klebsiella aerogenes MGH 78]